mgnify:FL=1
MTQQTFEQYVPAFRSPTAEIFKKVEPLLLSLRKEWEERVISAEATLSDDDLHRLDAAVALRSAYRLVPQLDLVLTPTGFGIVSNQNTAPASPSRVSALRDQLRQEASLQEDLLMEHLAAMGALRLPHATVKNLLWTPRLLRTFGVTLHDGQHIYKEELPSIEVSLARATDTIIDILSAPLYSALLQSQYQPLEVDDPKPYTLLINDSRRLLAALVQSCRPTDTTQPGVKEQVRHVVDYLERNAERLPHYLTSSTHLARKASPYENKKTDASFFFG